MHSKFNSAYLSVVEALYVTCMSIRDSNIPFLFSFLWILGIKFQILIFIIISSNFSCLCRMRQPPMIRTMEQLKTEIKLLETLSEIGVAVRILKKEGDVSVHPIDRHYINMKCEIFLLNANDPKYKVFLKMLKSEF